MTASSITSRRPCRRPGTPKEFVHGLPIGGGFRVPCIIVSPWTAGGWVCSEPFDHTSVLRFLEKFTGVREPNISEWRRQTFGDLTSAFRFGDAKASPPQLPDTVNTLSRPVTKRRTSPLPRFPAQSNKLRGRRWAIAREFGTIVFDWGGCELIGANLRFDAACRRFRPFLRNRPAFA